MKFSDVRILLPGMLLALSVPFNGLTQTSAVSMKPSAIRPSAPLIEPGVSLQLAQERVRTLQHIRYTLHLSLPVGVKTPVAGEETISFDCLDNTVPLQIDFKGAPSQLGEVRVNGQTVPARFEQEHLILESRYLRKGADSIHLQFIAGDRPLNRNADYLYTLLVPDRARTLFPCFDQPNLKAVFTLSLTLPVSWSALANAPLRDSTVDGASAVKTYRFLPSDKISTYLFSFAAGKFFEAARDMHGRVLHGYYRETDSTKIRLSLDSLFRIQDQAIAFLQEYTQIPFPFQKFDFVAIPDFQFGGMEHVGAIQYQASSLFLDESATAEQFNTRSNLLSHETSHMWFGDLVTMRWFNDVWMKEVFANFMADKIGNITRPGGDFQLKFLTSHFPAAYATDRTAGANPIRQTLDNLQDAGSLYGNIIYNKAPVMMQQLERLMGEVPFRNGVREYLKAYAYGNASWPDLIHILGKYTSYDLEAWNKVWVNEAGRPRISYQCETKGNAIARLTLAQRGEDGSARIWPQFFELALVYGDHTEQYTVNLKAATMTVPEVSGKPVPLYILFNSGGEGYGVFPIDTQGIARVASLPDPVMRASAYINQYENMLDGSAVQPHQLLEQDEQYLLLESKELNLGALLGQISSVFWHFTTPADRTILAPGLEKTLWAAMEKADQPNEKKLLFLAYTGIELTRSAQDSVYKVWNGKQPPAGVKLSEDDYTGLAAGLALRTYPGYREILETQASRIQNPDRRARFGYIQPSLSEDQAVRDSFFLSLRDRRNREKEAWVLSALSYLHHPLRTGASEKYLPASLDWLLEIQRTGDVFFPERWLQASFGNYQTAGAAAVVRHFLETHPDYNPKLKEKILQTTDNLFRAEKLLGGLAPRQ
jgi:aminopeptidase N